MSRRGRERTLRKDRTGASPLVVGILTAIVAGIGIYFGFTKSNPFANPYEVKAVFASATSIRPKSPVRIAGVTIGKVKSVDRQPDTDAAIITMEIAEKGLPLHKDATMKIRPRIFLEGNFFVDLEPGSPSAPVLGDGDTLAIAQTASPVQFDEVLTALQGDTRESLKTLIQGYGSALTSRPRPVDDADGGRFTEGESAAESLNGAAEVSGDALRGTAIVNDAFTGSEPEDLSRLIKGLGKVTAALDTRRPQLQDLVTNFNVTLGALAAEDTSLRASVRQLAPTLRTTSITLASLNAAFPSTRAFAREILPGVRETPATIAASFPWITQTRRLLGDQELRGLTRELQPTVGNLSKVVDTGVQLLPQIDDTSRCLSQVVLPTGDIKIQEGDFTTGVENYKEFWYSLVGLAGEDQNFDANGPYVRFQTGGGTKGISTSKGGTLGEPYYANVTQTPLGTRPAFTGTKPPYNSTAKCKNQKIPDLNGAKTGPPDG
nr:MCE family protein [Solirubrobacterales bacterium]